MFHLSPRHKDEEKFKAAEALRSRESSAAMAPIARDLTRKRRRSNRRANTVTKETPATTRTSIHHNNSHS
jgi:hypothetical protein